MHPMVLQFLDIDPHKITSLSLKATRFSLCSTVIADKSGRDLISSRKVAAIRHIIWQPDIR